MKDLQEQIICSIDHVTISADDSDGIYPFTDEVNIIPVRYSGELILVHLIDSLTLSICATSSLPFA